MKVWTKSCPKCAGDLKEETGPYDTYVFCVACRYTLTQREKAALLPGHEAGAEAAPATTPPGVASS